jgi:hypothetical protein
LGGVLGFFVLSITLLLNNQKKNNNQISEKSKPQTKLHIMVHTFFGENFKK